MHNFNLKIIKVTLVILALSAVLDMLVGMAVLKKENYYFRSSYLKMQWDFVKTKTLFINYNCGGLSKWIFSKGTCEMPKSERSGEAQFIPVLLYHGVVENSDWKPDEVSIKLEDFRNQLFALKKAGWETIRLEDYLAFIRRERKLPEKSFMITFDDGRSDSFYPVDPVLRTLNYSAIMHVITNRSFLSNAEQGHFHLSKIELEKMLESEHWQIASHGRDDHDLIATSPNGLTGHYLSNKMWLTNEKRYEMENEYKSRIYNDLKNSKKDLEDNLGVKVLAFAYPFGDFGQTSENFPESHGDVIDEARKVYPVSFCQTASGDFIGNYPEGSFLAKRIVVNSFMNPQELLTIFEKNYSKSLPYSDDFSQNNGWMLGWGRLDISNNSMVIKNSPNEESGLAFLSGSYMWDNYFLNAKIKLQKKGKISMASRYHDGNNYMSCDYDDTSVSLVRKINKESQSESTVQLDTELSSGREANIAVQVSDYEMSCFLDGKKVISGPIDPELGKGGIGFKIWDPVERDSTLVVKNVRIEKNPSIGLSQ